MESLNDLDHFEYGWIAIFTSIVSDSLGSLDPDTSETWAHFPGWRTWSAGMIDKRGSAAGMIEIPGAFDAAPAKGHPDAIITKEMTRVDFWKRLLAISDVVTEEVRDLTNDLLDTGEKKAKNKGEIPIKTQEPKPEAKGRKHKR